MTFRLAYTDLDAVADLVAPAPDDGGDRIQAVLCAARRHLDMEVAFVGEFTGGREVLRHVEGDGASFGFRPDASSPLHDTYCRLLVDGRVGCVIPDSGDEPAVATLDVTRRAGIGAYVGVPVELPDGTLYGALCCASHSPDPSLGERDVKFLRVLATLVAEMIGGREQHNRALRDRADRVDAILREGRFRTVLQPIVDLRSGDVVGAEALTRFDDRPARSPDAWFADAVAVARGAELELAVLSTALPALHDLPADSYLSVNLSSATLTSAQLPALLDDVDTARIVLELTEHERVADYDEVGDALRRLRRRGIRLAIDDAGAGFSTLRHILRLSPDIIKLDIGLTRGVQHDPVRRALSSALVSFSAEAHAQLIAEGIECRDELDSLRDLGVAFGQGYHLGHPSPAPPPLRLDVHGAGGA